MNTISTLKLNFLASLLVIFFIGCRSDSPSSTDSTIYIQMSKDPDRLNPVLYPISYARKINQNIFLPLAEYDPFSFEYLPILIEKIPEAIPYGDNGVQYDITFREDAQWSDGMPVTADDFLFTIKMAAHPKTAAKNYRSYFNYISRAEIDPSNNRNISLYFDKNVPQALDIATNVEILPAHVYDPNSTLKNVELANLRNMEWFDAAVEKDSSLISFSNEINSQKYSRDVVVGPGPYELVEWIPNEVVILQKVDNYWGAKYNNTFTKQGPDRIIHKIIPDETSAIAQLKSGLLDFIPTIGAENYQTLKEEENSAEKYTFQEAFILRYFFFTLNTNHPALQSTSARQALTHCTDIDEMISAFEKGFAKKTNSFVNPSKPYYNDDIKPFSFDIEKAKDLLAKDGWSDSNGNGIVDKKIDGRLTDFSLQYFASGNTGVNLGLMLKENAAKAGIDIEVLKQDYSITKAENIGTGNFGIVASALTQSIGVDDPYLRFHSDNAKLGGSNTSMYKNERVDALIDEIKNDPSTFDKNILEIQAQIYEDQPYIFLYVPQGRFVSSKKWRGKVSIKRPGYFANAFYPASVLAN